MNMYIWMYQEFKQRFWGKIVWNFILKQIPVSEKIKPTVKLTCVDEINIGSGWYTAVHRHSMISFTPVTRRVCVPNSTTATDRIGDNHVCHQQFSRNPQTFHVRHDFLLGLPTITSILRRISVVRSQVWQIWPPFQTGWQPTSSLSFLASSYLANPSSCKYSLYTDILYTPICFSAFKSVVIWH